jgi:hypothetical protein
MAIARKRPGFIALQGLGLPCCLGHTKKTDTRLALSAYLGGRFMASDWRTQRSMSDRGLLQPQLL